MACLKQSTSKVTHLATMSSQNASVVPLTTASMHGLHIQTLDSRQHLDKAFSKTDSEGKKGRWRRGRESNEKDLSE